MKLKRILATVLCFAMVLSTMSFSVFAEDDTIYVAQIGDDKFETVLEALTAAMESTTATEVKLLQDSTELLPTDFEFIVKSDVVITSDTPVTASFYNNGTKYDLIFGSENNNTITIDENVTLKVNDRNIWLGYYGDKNVTVKVYGTLSAGYQFWSGSNIEVYGTLESLGEALVLRRGKTLTVNGGKVNANYFSILAGNIDAKNGAIIECGPVWISNTGNYANEGNVEIALDNATLTSSSNLKSVTEHADGVIITIMNGSTASFTGNGHGASQLDESTNLVVSGNSTQLNIKGLTNNGTIEVTDGGKVSATGTVTNNGTIEVENEDDFEGVVSGNQPEISTTVVATVDGEEYTDLQAALDAAAAGEGNVTVEILENINLTNVDWNPVSVSAPKYPVVTVNGNGKIITGLNDMLFAGTWAGGSGLIINDLTIADSAIVNDKDDTKGTVGVGAFIGFPQASATVTLNNCHLVNSSVEGGHWTGGLIGYAAGYAGNDGPVFMNLTINECSVKGSTITGKGSAGGIIGHATGNAWTQVTITDTTVSDNTVASTGSSTNKAGAVIGTIGAAGQATTVNGVEKTGGVSVAATVSGNNVTSNSATITTIYGRQGTNTGMLYVTGGEYDNYPIEENVAYAAPIEGYEIADNGDGTFGVAAKPVAKIGDVEYATLEAAIAVAVAGDTIELISDITLTEAVTLPAGITFNGNGFSINGTIYAGGDLTFAGHTKITSFSASYYDRTITIGEGACLEITGAGRVSLAYGNVFNITGSISDAKTANTEDITPSLIIPGGISITGGNDAEVNVTNAYVVIGSTTSKNNSANGTFKLNFDNSIADFTSQLTFSEPSTGYNPTFELNVKDSILTAGTKLCIAAPNTTVTVDNSTVNLGTYIRNSGNLIIKNGSVLTGSTIQFGENGGNDGTIRVDNSTLTITSTTEGHALDGKGEGLIVLKNNSVANITYLKDSLYSVDSTSILNTTPLGNCSEYKEYVARIGDTGYETLADAVAAAVAGDTITIKEGTYALPTLKAGITVEGEGNVILEGTLSGTLEDLTLKNLHIKGSNAQRWAYAKGNLKFENVTFEATSVYAIHFDGITEGSTLLYIDCTIIGWVAMSGSPASCVFDGCTIRDNGTYGVIRTYFDAEIKNCTFDVDGANPDDAYQDGIHAVDATVTVNDCTNANGDIKDILNISRNSYIYVDDVLVLAPTVAKIGDAEYFTLADAIADAQSGDTITLLADVEVTESIVITGKSLTLDLGEYTIYDKSTRVLTSEDDIWGLIALENGAKLTVCGNGTIECNYEKVQGGWTGMAYCLDVDETSELTVTGGNFVNGNGGIQTRGKVTVNGGTFVSHNGGTCIMALYENADVTVNDGTFKDYVADNDVYTGSGAVWSGFGATVNINGGIYDFEADPENGNVVWTLFPAQNAIAGYGENANMKVTGGTFINFNPATDVIVDYSASEGFTFGSVVAEDCSALESMDGKFFVGTKPTATVNNLGKMVIQAEEYMVYGGGSNTADMPLNFVMQFVADQDEEDMDTSPYAEWYADFVITVSGLNGESFVADGCYLAGYYGDFGWVKVPIDGMTIEEGVRYPVMLGVGFGQKYEYICEGVKDFRCAMFLTDDVLEQNPDLKVNLELAVVDNSEGSDKALEALMDADSTKVLKVESIEYKAEDFKPAVAKIGDVKYESLDEAFAVGGDIVLLSDIELASTIAVNNDASLDLNGHTISGTCNAGQAHMFMVNNGATMTIKDSDAEQKGKITYAGNNSTGWIVDVEGDLVLESGTLELTGTWNIGYAVDVRPNAWGTAYTEPTTFVMNGGKIISSDGAVRVASSSADSYDNIVASFTMDGGEIEAAWDGVFVQQSNAAWDVLNVTINDGTIKSGLNPIRFYGPAATSYVNGEDCVDIAFNGGTLTYTGTEAREWLVDGILRLGGGVTVDDFLKDTAVTASENFAELNVTEGYEWVESNGVYTLQKAEPELIGFNRLSASLDSSLALNIYLNKADLPGEDYYAEIKHVKATGDVVTTEIPYEDWTTSGNEIAFRYTGIAAKEMADIIKVTVYNADGTQKSLTAETSLRKYATSMINLGLSNAAYRHWVPVVVDMLNYGAAAQTFFEYNLDDLANNGINDYQDYATQEYELDNSGISATGTAKEASLTLDGMIKLNVYFKNVTEDMYATYSYTTHAGTNISERVEYDSFTSRTIGGVQCFAPPVGIAVADVNTPVTVTMFKKDGTEAGKVVYKASAYLNYSINNTNDDIYPALAKFATSAKAAFAKK